MNNAIRIVTDEQERQAAKHAGHRTINATAIGDSVEKRYCLDCKEEFTLGTICRREYDGKSETRF
jgi:hypothetical protein